MTALEENQLGIDLGCGASKREGFVGLDRDDLPGVDHVLDLQRERWPFEDATVDYVYSSHFFEHVYPHDELFQEIGRVCKDGATIEIWTPYAFSNTAFLYTHLNFITEEQWVHICCRYPEVYEEVLRGRWLLRNVNFVVEPQTERDLENHGLTVAFGVRYLKSVVDEFGILARFSRDKTVPPARPTWTYSHSRYGERWELPAPDDPLEVPDESRRTPNVSALASLKGLRQRPPGRGSR